MLFVFISIPGVGGALLDGLVGVAPLLMRPQFPQICRQSMMNKGGIFLNDVYVPLFQTADGHWS